MIGEPDVGAGPNWAVPLRCRPRFGVDWARARLKALRRIVLAACRKSEVMTVVASQETVTAVRGVLDRFSVAYSAKDLNGVLACFDDGPDGVLVGTGADEWRVGAAALRAQSERDFAQADSLAIEYHDLHIGGGPGVAWFAAKGTVRAKVDTESLESAVRLTGVLTLQGQVWKIVQSHLSFPAPEQQPGHSF
jgi:ketosteroid isomerase-like protein